MKADSIAERLTKLMNKLEMDGFYTDANTCWLAQEALAAAETERDEARKKALEALGALCDQDAAYSGNQILITCNSHSDAIERMRVARETLATLLALQENSNENRP